MVSRDRLGEIPPPAQWAPIGVTGLGVGLTASIHPFVAPF
jgi:hypothetical protein